MNKQAIKELRKWLEGSPSLTLFMQENNLVVVDISDFNKLAQTWKSVGINDNGMLDCADQLQALINRHKGERG